ncbi:hypothetical protein [Effusibacillus pohliae]|uniref:hypothetical protein n=1 Tax=Effusibacillus pohliae TaxID=232270 RepID=UPI00036FC77D|nr:hypothetical protein [Effusibacillus pohliae]
MAFLTGVAQVVVFLILLKVTHIVYWNLRKSYFIHPWLLETVIAVVLVWLFHLESAVWTWVIVTSIALGLIRGDQEAKTGNSRQLL